MASPPARSPGPRPSGLNPHRDPRRPRPRGPSLLDRFLVAVGEGFVNRVRAFLERGPRRHERRCLTAVLAAGLAMSLLELTGAWAVRWIHGPGYVALMLGSTLALSALVAVAGWWRALDPRLALALWTVLAGGILHGWMGALLLVAGIAVGARWLLDRPLPLLGVLAAGGLAGGSVGALWLSHSLGLGDEPDGLGASVAFAILFALIAALGREVELRLRRRTTPRRALLGVLGLFLLVAAEPVLHRPTGRRRLPRQEDLLARLPEAASRPHVFLLVLDTVRADHLSVYGYYRDTTPNLKRWIERRQNALVYPGAYANGTWTVPSHASLFTGLTPANHGAHFALEGGPRFQFAIDPEARTLATRLQEGGYATLGAFANNWLRMVGGMGRGFDRFFRSHHAEPWPLLGEWLRSALVPGLFSDAVKGAARAEQVTDDLLSMVEPWSEGARPLFAFANYGDAHGPYAPPPGYRGKFHVAHLRDRPGHLSIHDSAQRLEEQKARYDEELLYLDHHVGRLLDRLDELGILADSWVFVTSDHGEAFGEHGVTEHGTTVYDEVTRIPLIVFPPDGVQLDPAFEPVSLTDVAITIASLGGVPFEGDGVDLQVPYVQRATRIEFYGDPYKARTHGEQAAHAARALVRGRFKLIDRGGELELYDLLKDHEESRNLASELPDAVRLLKKELPELRPPTGSQGPSGSEADLEHLRAMGYVGEGE